MKRIVVFILLFFIWLPVFSQESSFIPEKLSTYLNNELSGDRGFEYIRWQTHYHRPSGSKGYEAVAKLIKNWAKDFGLTNVHIARQQIENPTWDAISGELWVVEPREIKLGSYEEIAVSIPNNCPSAHETVELVYIGEGTNEEDFRGIDVAGKAVLTSSSPRTAMRTAVWERGAAGIISYSNGRPMYVAIHDLADQVAYSSVPLQSSDGKPAKWAFMTSPRKATMLQGLLKEAKSNNQTVKIKVDIETKFYDPGEESYVWGEIQGSQIHDQDIILTSHIQEEKFSANDDASGCASMLEIGRTINRFIKEGRIPQPKRDIIFWWADEISSEYRYFRDHPEERKNMLVNINQDMVGAKQSMNSRVQQIIMTPYSIPSYLNDVISAITEYVIKCNTHYLPVRAMGKLQPFAKPIFSNLGTMERFNAMIVPYFDSSDHMVFCESIIGVPGVGLINQPDFYIHSTADDLDNVDQTQLKRNMFIVAATTLFLANAGDKDVPLIAGEVFSKALGRLGDDLSTATQHIRDRKGGSYEQSYKEAKNLIDQAVIREVKAVESVLVFANPGGKNEAHVKKQVEKIKQTGDHLTGELNELYFLMSGKSSLPSLALTPEEKTMAEKVPYNIDNVDEYFEKRSNVRRVRGLHSLMSWECYNFVNGKNSYLDIFRAVHAEALSAGEFHYGTVSMEAVRTLLDNAVEAGVIRLK